MAEPEVAAAAADVLEVDPEAFQEQVREDADVVTAELEAGTFDNPQGIVGLEYEFYAVSAPGSTEREAGAGDVTPGSLRRVPRRLLEHIGFEKELGLHNAEMSTSPQPMNRHGLAAQGAEVRARLAAAREPMRAEGMRLVSDALWTIPPAGETAGEYIGDSVEIDGIRVATNMSDAARYHAMANSDAPAGMRIDAPHVTFQADTVMPESLITSIQPHYQVPHADDLPEYFRYAIRIAGPLLALGVNSPFFPPDLYDDAPADAVLADAWMEHRISVFETTMNAEGVRKVKFPRDVETTEGAVDRIVEDPVFIPMPVERGERFDDRFAALRTKHGTYWRWVRPVFGGATRSAANARIEFRPLPAQPTVRDTVAFQAAFVGLIEGMHARDHPVRDLDWADARRNFYGAMRAGLGADLAWITADGEPTTQHAIIYDDLFDAAAAGLRARGLDEGTVDRYLGPLQVRAERGITPAGWKHRGVAERVEAGAPLSDAIPDMQRSYIERQADTLLEGSFVDWLE